MPRRVVITGVGVLTPIGTNKEEFWANCLSGLTRVESIPKKWRTYNEYQSTIWSPLPEINFAEHGIGRIEMMQLDPVQMLALSATRSALVDAGFSCRCTNEKKNTFAIEGTSPKEWGTFVGTGVGGMATYTGCAGNHILSPVRRSCENGAAIHESHEAGKEFGDIARSIDMPSRFNRYAVSMSMPNACSAAVSIKYSLRGPCATPCCACASGTVAVGQAFRAIREGRISRAVAGGSEYLADPYGGIFRGFDVAKTLAIAGDTPQTANRPFDVGRTGFLFAEGGCGILILENSDSARERGAHCLAEIVGFEENADAFSIMAMDEGGAQVEALTRELLAGGGSRPEDIDYVNSHGTGTKTNDEMETAVLERVFGKGPLVNSTKSLIGHTVGAAGAIEAVVTALSIDRNRVHPCVNLTDPIRDLSFVLDNQEAHIETALSYSFAFGGHNAGLMLKKFQP